MKRSTAVLVVAAVVVLVALGSYTAVTLSESHSSPVTVNVGYYLNINHAPAILGISGGSFQKAVGSSAVIDTTIFTSGGPEMEALLAGKIDIAYVGPDPAVNAYIQSMQCASSSTTASSTSSGSASSSSSSSGTLGPTSATSTGSSTSSSSTTSTNTCSSVTSSLEIIAGVTSGGALFVVQNDSGITSVKDLGGKTFAAPGAGNTQDIALRYYLQENGYKTTNKGGNVTVLDTTDANIVTLFAEGKIAGAWVPEPYGDQLIQQFGGKLFLDERNLWPGGDFSTTELVVRTQFLQQYPGIVKEIVSADVAESQWINAHASEAQTDLESAIYSLSGVEYSASILNASFSRLSFTYDPLETSVLAQADHAYDVGDLTQNPTNSSLSSLYNLSILNSVLKADNLPAVQS